jgi:hypothetical protein
MRSRSATKTWQTRPSDTEVVLVVDDDVVMRSPWLPD